MGKTMTLAREIAPTAIDRRGITTEAALAQHPRDRR